MIRNFLRRYGLPVVLLLLLALNGFRYWSRKDRSEAVFPGPGGPGSPGAPPGADGPPPPDAAARQRMEAALQKLPPDQRQAIEERMKADREFFESIRNLPEDQRLGKITEHFAQNPPPPGFDPGSLPPPPGGPGDGGPPGEAGPMHLPPPAIRRGMDQQIANTQKND